MPARDRRIERFDEPVLVFVVLFLDEREGRRRLVVVFVVFAEHCAVGCAEVAHGAQASRR